PHARNRPTRSHRRVFSAGLFSLETGSNLFVIPSLSTADHGSGVAEILCSPRIQPEKSGSESQFRTGEYSRLLLIAGLLQGESSYEGKGNRTREALDSLVQS